MKSKSTTLVAARQRRETRVLGLEFVIAIGASAGGLEALERLFNGLTGSLNCAFVVIQHLSPDHKSMMVSLLSRHTDMAVHTVEEGMPLEPGNVYLIPPAKIMTLDNGRLRLLPKDQKTLSLPIDMFFTSLAQQMGARAVAVVLSGTGSDGSRGILAINEAGGLVFVQEPQTAKFDGMPRSAIATGLVDGIYAPEEVAAQIVHHVNNPQPQIPRTRRVTKAAGRSDDMLKLLQLLHHSTGVDFTEYKANTVSRRIERRMHLRHCPDIATFTRWLDENPEEIAALKREILIPVTGFFRDQPSFSALAEEVIDKIVSAWDSNDPIRVWSAATSTGEEAYSIAILFEEAFERQRKWLPLKIFATDVEQSYIETAANGVYGDSIVAEVSPERLERHFTRKGDLYTVTKRIRQHIIFARHNVVSDPPFTKIDLILCRNMLIYLRPEVQERVLRRFQYALSPSGILFLGSSESLGSVAKDFTPLLASHKIYRVVRRAPLPLDTGAISVTEATRGRHGEMVRRRNPDTLATDAFFAGLVAAYVPPSLLVNEQRELVHVVGDMTRLLLVPQGGATHDISKLLVPPLAGIATSLTLRVFKEGRSLRSDRVSMGDGLGLVAVIARPITTEPFGGRFACLSFEFASPLENEPNEELEIVSVDREASERIRTLEEELDGTRENLQATIEELETANEELQAANEELMASNEELQSTNEELQSVNEELYTVNSEYQEKIDVLNRLNYDLENMSRATAVAAVFVDKNLTITRFTSDATNFLRLRSSDIGRPIEDFSADLIYPSFIEDMKRTAKTAQAHEAEIRLGNGRWYLVRILPYIEDERHINGAVMTLFDVTSLKDVARLQAILDSLPEHIAVIDRAGVVKMVNAAWRDFARENGDGDLAHTGVGVNYLSSCGLSEVSDSEDARRAHEGLTAILEGRARKFSLRYPCHSLVERRWFVMHAAAIAHGEGGAVVSHINITPWYDGDVRDA